MGILSCYRTASGGEKRWTSDATRVALLAAMGIDAATEAAAAEALGGIAERERSRLLEPVLVVTEGRAAGELALTVVAPRVHGSDPLREVRHGIEVRRFPYPSGGRRLKEEPRLSPLRLGAYLVSGLWVTARQLRRARGRLIVCHWVLPSGLIE